MSSRRPHDYCRDGTVVACVLAWLVGCSDAVGTGTSSSGAGGTSSSHVGGWSSSLAGNAAVMGSTGSVTGSGGSAAAAGTGSSRAGTSGGDGLTSATYRVEGPRLFDPCGDEVILRGVNEMIIYSPDRDGIPEFAEIAKTGANAVRIVWSSEGSAEQLETAISNAIGAHLLPIVEHHGATGDLAGLPAVVDYWTKPDVVAVLKKHERRILLNIANEAGDGSVTNTTFVDAYQPAISRIRATGLVLPLLIDAPQWGQNINVLQQTWQTLTAHDPQKNLLFSVHMWWHDPDGKRLKAELAESKQAGMPLVVGEFAQHAVAQCDLEPFAYEVLLTEAQQAGIGWLAWSWGSVNNQDCSSRGSFDMTVAGTFGDWEAPWAQIVALSHPASIMNSSRRTAFITTGSCL